MNKPHKDVETYLKIHELVQEHETDLEYYILPEVENE